MYLYTPKKDVPKDNGASLFFLFLLIPIISSPDSLGILRKPAFLATLALLEKLADAPKAAGTYHTVEGRGEDILYQEGGGYGAYSYHEEYPPIFRARVIFCLQDDRVEETYYQKCANGNDDASEM